MRSSYAVPMRVFEGRAAKKMQGQSSLSLVLKAIYSVYLRVTSRLPFLSLILTV